MKLDSKREYKLNECIWLGELPDDWDFKRLKYVSKVKPSNVDKKSEEDEFPVLLCNYNEVYKNDFIDSSLNFMEATASPDEIEKFQIEKGDVIITKDSETPEEIALPAYVLENLNNTLCGYHLSLIRSDKVKVIGSYLFRLFQSKQFNAQFTVAANGITRFGLDTYSIKNAVVSLPTVSEQQSIAQFLDYKTEQIDKLIEKKEKLLKLLEEKRIALITNAVTGKLTCHSEERRDEESHTSAILPLTKGETQRGSKDSGVEWLGNIPQNWERKRLRFLIKHGLSNGLFKKKEFWGEGIKIVNVSDIYNKDFIVDVSNLDLVDCNDDEKEIYKVNEGDFFFVRSSLKLEGVGHSASIVNQNEPLVYECHLVKGSPNKNLINARFLNLFLNSHYAKDTFISVANTVTMTTIDQNKFKDIFICFPSLDQQEKIVSFLESEIEKIKELEKLVNTAIDKLKEYRTSLITSAVTGKIDLRNWQPTNLKSPYPYFKERDLG